MLNSKIVKQLKQASIEDRIKIIEIVLQSLKKDMKRGTINDLNLKSKPFKIRKFNLGTEVRVDRTKLYSERG